MTESFVNVEDLTKLVRDSRAELATLKKDLKKLKEQGLSDDIIQAIEFKIEQKTKEVKTNAKEKKKVYMKLYMRENKHKYLTVQPAYSRGLYQKRPNEQLIQGEVLDRLNESIGNKMLETTN